MARSKPFLPSRKISLRSGALHTANTQNSRDATVSPSPMFLPNPTFIQFQIFQLLVKHFSIVGMVKVNQLFYLIAGKGQYISVG
jgi:hypothetical protein